MEKVPASFATIGFSNPTKILRSTWCPDKDLLVVVAHVGAKDKLGLWNMSGSKKWEVDIESESANGREIVDIAWSPDGQYIAVASNPPLVTLHSLQDGQQERALHIPFHSPETNRLTSIWWLNEYRTGKKAGIPDIFKRGGNITGSAHAILKTQPLLDALHEPQSLSATDLFGFKGGSGKSSRNSIPEVISTWPTLPTDPLVASIQAQATSSKESRPGEELDEADDSNVNSLLVVSDEGGVIHGFLDGSYPLGAIRLGGACSVISIHKERNAILFLYQQIRSLDGLRYSAIQPAIVPTPFLIDRSLRDMARASSSCRELTWYSMRVVKEMRDAWMGTPANTGATELGSNWIKAIEKRQKEKFGHKDPNALVDLALFLTTRKASDALADFFGSGDLMSERGLQKWESNMTEALTKLRDYSSRRLAPASQRLHVVLQEVYGWSQLPQYSAKGLLQDEIKLCMELSKRTIVHANWLASTARAELSRFREFMLWLRYETSPPPTDTNAGPLPQKHDLLDVCEYLDSGLVVSSIDKWFIGGLSTFEPSEIHRPAVNGVKAAVAKARVSLKQGLKWPPLQQTIRQADHSRPEENMSFLMQQLSTRCQQVFLNAANASSRGAAVVNSLGQLARESGVGDSSQSPMFIREHTVDDISQGNFILQYLAIQTPRADQSSYLFLVRMNHAKDGSELARSMSFVTFQCSIASTEEDGGGVPIEVVEAEFFDDRILILIYRPLDQEQATSIASIGYSDLVFEDAPADYIARSSTREVLMQDLLQRVRDGQIAAVPIPITGSRELVGCADGGVSLAVNGRIGRRVACILDKGGLTLEVLDMEGEDSQEDEEDEEMETTSG
ncbi:anaphase-promoting complex, cyclosome, subunit 4-domain-containing protein [Irpex rosettiformis]|uniref:Anaphase-promoting complex, cyclosome, subunit 4-domain-containing protein n=1 Tax=Irpex rosettiformis TaxID=378272 RepID=A0ACB8UKL5_9APHY|nr:anaphase-promoting complex, cyclosome, subunit 4-domain-containing protein [Irpex rosettiformis]